MGTGSLNLISDIVNNSVAKETLQQNVGLNLLTKSLDAQKEQANELITALQPANSATPHLGTRIDTYA